MSEPTKLETTSARKPPPNPGKGNRFGGRAKGTPNKKTQEVIDIIRRLKFDPITVMVKIAQADVPCSVCRGKGRTKYQPGNGAGEKGFEVVAGKLLERTCQSCYGRGKEIISPQLRGDMAGRVARFVFPERASVHMTGGIEVTQIEQRLQAGRQRVAEARREKSA